MENFINSRAERAWGELYFKDHVMDPTFPYKNRKKELSDFWLKRGWHCSMMYADYYARSCGVESDRYVPMDIFYFFLLPALNRYDMRIAWSDKNLYSAIFSGCLMPATVIKNRAGVFYDCDDRVIDAIEALERVKSFASEMIIKPSVDSTNGDGVRLIDPADDQIPSILASYGTDYIVQQKLAQHPLLARLNSSSLNTMRLFTYRDIDRRVHFLTGKSSVRFGGESSVMDNVSAGGAFCPVADDGSVIPSTFRFKTLSRGSLAVERGISDQVIIPSFGQAMALAESLHERLPYFDLVGWDVAIDP